MCAHCEVPKQKGSESFSLKYIRFFPHRHLSQLEEISRRMWGAYSASNPNLTIERYDRLRWRRNIVIILIAVGVFFVITFMGLAIGYRGTVSIPSLSGIVLIDSMHRYLSMEKLRVSLRAPLFEYIAYFFLTAALQSIHAKSRERDLLVSDLMPGALLSFWQLPGLLGTSLHRY